ncbi:hypothetical protein M9H77_04885 [Catharanthus roseus]|uniref:Uncharacterized protein n=1 Tax=Catharanthus roseus TaxID=4058 RepID=A0ACC0CFM2_CATRO|nr:hypothetical protein M9H77_04885 [Catharanthus roseus]
MEIPWSRAKPCIALLMGFTGQTIHSEEKISLLVNVGDTVYTVQFLSSAFNQLRAKIATCDLSMEVSNGSGIHVIYGDCQAAQKYLSIDLCMKLVEVLVKFKDIFSWNSDDLGGIPKEIVEHKLGIPDTAKPINNEDEYEALFVGLQMAQSLKITHLLVKSDSQIVIGQVTGTFEAKEDNIKNYLALIQRVISGFQQIHFEKLSASEPMEGTWMELLKEKSIISNVCTVMEVDNWRTPIRNSIVHEQLPDNPQEARKVRTTASRSMLIDDQLYRTMEIHEGICGSHIGINILVKRTMRYGYYYRVENGKKRRLFYKPSTYADSHECTTYSHGYKAHKGRPVFVFGNKCSSKGFKGHLFEPQPTVSKLFLRKP